MDDAALAEKIFAVAGRLLDASTLSNDERVVTIARTTAQIARRLVLEPDDAWRKIAGAILEAEELGVRVADHLRERSR